VSIPLLLAAALALVLVAAHSYLGERYILARLFRRNELPRLFGGTEFTRRTLRFAWHITSVLGLGLAVMLAMLASGAGTPVRQAQIIAATWGVCGIVALVGSRGRHLSWIVFFTIAILVWYGSR
jgi:hypothetical protein